MNQPDSRGPRQSITDLKAGGDINIYQSDSSGGPRWIAGLIVVVILAIIIGTTGIAFIIQDLPQEREAGTDAIVKAESVRSLEMKLSEETELIAAKSIAPRIVLQGIGEVLRDARPGNSKFKIDSQEPPGPDVQGVANSPDAKYQPNASSGTTVHKPEFWERVKLELQTLSASSQADVLTTWIPALEELEAVAEAEGEDCGLAMLRIIHAASLMSIENHEQAESLASLALIEIYSCDKMTEGNEELVRATKVMKDFAEIILLYSRGECDMFSARMRLYLDELGGNSVIRDDVDEYYHARLCYEDAGNYEKAWKLLTRLALMDPGGKDEYVALAAIRVGISSYFGGDMWRAVELLDRGESFLPEDSEFDKFRVSVQLLKAEINGEIELAEKEKNRNWLFRLLDSIWD